MYDQRDEVPENEYPESQDGVGDYCGNIVELNSLSTFGTWESLNFLTVGDYTFWEWLLEIYVPRRRSGFWKKSHEMWSGYCFSRVLLGNERLGDIWLTLSGRAFSLCKLTDIIIEYFLWVNSELLSESTCANNVLDCVYVNIFSKAHEFIRNQLVLQQVLFIKICM